jgi:hypothetical protein
MFTGGLESSKWTGRGTAVVEPIVRVTAAGEWKSLPCDSESSNSCEQFVREYLNKTRTYTVISADGNGATIHSEPVKLSECFDYSGTGTYQGAQIQISAIAASSTDSFLKGAPIKQLDRAAAGSIRTALSAMVGKKMDSTQHLQLFSIELEGQKLMIVQRSLIDRERAPANERLAFIFAIAAPEDHGGLHIIQWKKNTEDEEERVLGTIRLKNGREFLVTVVSDPESHRFRVYGIVAGKLKTVYYGGGSSC